MIGGSDCSKDWARLGRLLSAAGPLGGLNGFDWLMGVVGTDCDIEPARGPVGMLLAPVTADAETGPVAGSKFRL